MSFVRRCAGRTKMVLAVALVLLLQGCGGDDDFVAVTAPAVEVPAGVPFTLDIDPGVTSGATFWLMEGSDEDGWRETHWLLPSGGGVAPSFGRIEGDSSMFTLEANDRTQVELMVPQIDGDEALICVEPATDVWCARVVVSP